MDDDRGRPRVLTRARRADRRRLPIRDRRGVLPGDAHPRGPAPEDDLALPGFEGAGGGRLPDHADLFFDNARFYFDFVGRARAAGVERADHPGDHADHPRRTGRAHGQDVRLIDPARTSARARQARRGRRRGGARLRRRVRDAAVRRAARGGRAGDSLLHAQPLTGHARDPQRAEAGAAVGEGRSTPARSRAPRRAAASRRRPRSARRRSRSGDRCPRPRLRAASASR